MRLKPCANRSITWYGVTPQVYWFNKTDYKGNMLLGRLPLGRKWNFTAGSSHTLVNWVTLIRVGFEKVVITVNVDSLEHATGHWANVFTCSSSYWTTISQNVTYISKHVTKGFFLISISPWWAYSQVIEDLKEKKNHLRNKYWLWLNGFAHKRRIVLKARPHESNDSKLWFMEFIRTPLSIIIDDSFITYIVSRSRFSDVLIRTSNFVVFRD